MLEFALGWGKAGFITEEPHEIVPIGSCQDQCLFKYRLGLTQS